MANKFKIKLKLTSFELEIEGSREDVPLMAQAVGQQMSGLLLPASGIVEGEIVEDKSLPQAPPEPQPKPRRKPASRRRSTASTSLTSNGKNLVVAAVDWRHDPSKWGNPQQDWTTADKSIWLLYVISKELASLNCQGVQFLQLSINTFANLVKSGRGKSIAILVKQKG